LVNIRMRGDHAKILAECAPQTEFQRETASIGDISTGFRDEQRTRCMVLVWAGALVRYDPKQTNKKNQPHPDLLPVSRTRYGQPQQDSALAPREGTVLRLTVHPHRRCGQPEPLGDPAGEVVR
jgi:hypothetical protein